MNGRIISKRFSKDLCGKIIDCINVALHDDFIKYMGEFKPDKTNAIPHLYGDWISTNFRKFNIVEDTDFVDFQRGGWSGRIIIDRPNRVTLTVMRAKRLKEIQHGKRDKLHYLQSIVGELNNAFRSDKQIEWDITKVQFTKEDIHNDCCGIFGDAFDDIKNYIHYVVAYETEHNNIVDIKLCLLDKDLQEVDHMSLNDLIKVDFSTLTDEKALIVSAESQKIEPTNLIKLKEKSLTKIKDKENEKQMNNDDNN